MDEPSPTVVRSLQALTALTSLDLSDGASPYVMRPIALMDALVALTQLKGLRMPPVSGGFAEEQLKRLCKLTRLRTLSIPRQPTACSD